MHGPDRLREELLGVGGVAAAEVSGGDAGTPAAVTVRLQRGADARSVGVQVQRLLASHGLRSRVTEDAVVVSPVEVGGHEATGRPGSAAPVDGVAAVSVEETGDGATVTVRSSTGGVEAVPTEPTEEGIARAVVVAVSRLVTGGGGRLVWISSETAGADRIVTVVVERANGARGAGAALVRGGMPHAVARAAWEAFSA